MRVCEKTRATAETEISLRLNLDGKGLANIETDCGFFKHMLELFTKHGNFDLDVKIKGDSFVDFHHSVEDTAITLGLAFKEALKDKKGINRYGFFILPMDESLILTALDFSGRVYLDFDVEFPPEYKVGDFDTELCEEFFAAFARSAEITLHIKKLSGSNVHHIIEGIFKSFARSLRQAVAIDAANKDKIPSTKGVL